MNYLKWISAILIILSATSIINAQSDLFTLESWETHSLTQYNLLPMYGEQAKSASQLEANDKFLSRMRIGKLRSDIRRSSNSLAERGWDFLYMGHLDTAMFRFNQAWLIDSTNIASYTGFATVYSILGDKKTTSSMFTTYSKIDTISFEEFQKVINVNREHFNTLKKLNFNLIMEYKPVEYHSTGQLFKDRKELDNNLFHWRWYHTNGSFLRIVTSGENSHDWIGEVISYHDNGIISYQGQWDDNLKNESIWTSYDRDGNIAKIEYWSKSSKKSSFEKTKTIIFKQEIPWDKGNFVTISDEGWEASQNNYPDGYILKIYNLEDPLYEYYGVWKNGKRGDELIKVIPENQTSMTAEGTFEWFNGKLYKIE